LASLPARGPERAKALRQRGAGRPPGALNRRTQTFRDFVLRCAGGQHPVVGIIEAYNRSVHDLARELGCTPLEAFKAQMDGRRVVLEYVEGKMPVSVKIDGAGVIPLIIEVCGQAPGATIEGEYFQPLSDTQPSELDGGKLDDDR
jgi:hypothetical protein